MMRVHIAVDHESTVPGSQYHYASVWVVMHKRRHSAMRH